MAYRELCILLPGHSLEDFPLHYEGADADNLLSAWTALWHPALIAAAGAAPTWRRSDDPPTDFAGLVLAVPMILSREVLAGDLLQRARDGGAVVLREGTREAMLAAALEPLGPAAEAIAPELVADFLALGYCYLQIELLTRHMRYASNLDVVRFMDHVVVGAKAATAGDEAAARAQLVAAFDMLGEQRDHYYSVDAYVFDLTLIADTTLGASLRRELAQPTAVNLLVSGELIERMARDEPESLARLREALAAGRAGLVGGESSERRVPLESLESALANLRTGIAQYQHHLDRRPDVYGRRSYGLSPLLPQLLQKLDFFGAIHATLDEGQFPEASQVKTRWEGVDATAIDAIARVPLDASQPGNFLSYCIRLGESMDSDHVATICFAHWPGHACRWYDELRRISRYTPALGKFLTADTYFRDTTLPGHLDRFSPNLYVAPYLKQDVASQQADPLSRVQRYWQEETARRAANCLSTLATLVRGTCGKPQKPAASAEEELANATKRFAAALPRSGEPVSGCLVANPLPFARRVAIELPGQFGSLAGQSAVFVAEHDGDASRAVVELPPCGFAWLEAASAPAERSRRAKRTPVLADDNFLRNELLEARIHPETGALVSIRSYKSRANLLSQQLAFRFPPGHHSAASATSQGHEVGYSRMVARSVAVVRSTPVVGEIRSEGLLLDDEHREIAQFRQTFRLWRGSPVVELDIELTPRVEPRADPWNTYYACRFAWRDDDALLYRSVQETRQPLDAKRFEAPHYIEIDDGHHKAAVLTGGLPWHRRTGDRMLDTLLIVRGETQRRFRLGIGVDLAHPYNHAVDLLLPPTRHVETAARPTPVTSGWLLHTGVKNVMATHWEPLDDGGRAAGFRVRLLETAGAPAKIALAALRPIASAKNYDFVGRSQGELRVEQGKVAVDLSRYEWVELEAKWSRT